MFCSDLPRDKDARKFVCQRPSSVLVAYTATLQISRRTPAARAIGLLLLARETRSDRTGRHWPEGTTPYYMWRPQGLTNPSAG
uniref:Uncharacterized protein n=1 Tax=Trichuris muris TaxID=70415 RepID=A0A5S6R1Y8_TRIMR